MPYHTMEYIELSSEHWASALTLNKKYKVFIWDDTKCILDNEEDLIMLYKDRIKHFKEE